MYSTHSRERLHNCLAPEAAHAVNHFVLGDYDVRCGSKSAVFVLCENQREIRPNDARHVPGMFA